MVTLENIIISTKQPYGSSALWIKPVVKDKDNIHMLFYAPIEENKYIPIISEDVLSVITGDAGELSEIINKIQNDIKDTTLTVVEDTTDGNLLKKYKIYFRDEYVSSIDIPLDMVVSDATYDSTKDLLTLSIAHSDVTIPINVRQIFQDLIEGISVDNIALKSDSIWMNSDSYAALTTVEADKVYYITEV